MIEKYVQKSLKVLEAIKKSDIPEILSSRKYEENKQPIGVGSTVMTNKRTYSVGNINRGSSVIHIAFKRYPLPEENWMYIYAKHERTKSWDKGYVNTPMGKANLENEIKSFRGTDYSNVDLEEELKYFICYDKLGFPVPSFYIPVRIDIKGSFSERISGHLVEDKSKGGKYEVESLMEMHKLFEDDKQRWDIFHDYSEKHKQIGRKLIPDNLGVVFEGPSSDDNITQPQKRIMKEIFFMDLVSNQAISVLDVFKNLDAEGLDKLVLEL